MVEDSFSLLLFSVLAGCGRGLMICKSRDGPLVILVLFQHRLTHTTPDLESVARKTRDFSTEVQYDQLLWRSTCTQTGSFCC